MPIFSTMAVEHDPLDYSGGITPLPKGPSTSPRIIFLWLYKGLWFWDFEDITVHDRSEPYGPFFTEDNALGFADFVSVSRGVIVNFEAPDYYYYHRGINYSLFNE